MNTIKVVVFFVLFFVGLPTFADSESKACRSFPISFVFTEEEPEISGTEKVCLGNGDFPMVVTKELFLNKIGRMYSLSHYFLLNNDGSITRNDSVAMMKDGNMEIMASGIGIINGKDEVLFSLLTKDKKEVFAVGVNRKTKMVTHYYPNKAEQ